MVKETRPLLNEGQHVAWDRVVPPVSRSPNALQYQRVIVKEPAVPEAEVSLQARGGAAWHDTHAGTAVVRSDDDLHAKAAMPPMQWLVTVSAARTLDVIYLHPACAEGRKDVTDACAWAIRALTRPGRSMASVAASPSLPCPTTAAAAQSLDLCWVGAGATCVAATSVLTGALGAEVGSQTAKACWAVWRRSGIHTHTTGTQDACTCHPTCVRSSGETRRCSISSP